MELKTTVGRPRPRSETYEAELKLVPLTVTVVGVVVPVVRLAGLKEVMVGVPMFTATEAAGEVPPPGAGEVAVRERLPAAARSAAVSVTFSWVGLT